MKRNIFVVTGIALALASSLNTSWAQDAAPAANQPAPPASGNQSIPVHFASDPAGQPPSPAPIGTNQTPRLPPARMRQGRPVFTRALSDLRMAKLELQRTEGDLGGHKQSALEACDKALQELAEVIKALPTPPPPQRPVPPPAATAPPPAAPPGATPPPQP
jgi:hypothetical protein